MAANPASVATDEVLEALEALVTTLKENSERNQIALRRAAQIQSARAEGKSYREIVSDDSLPLIVELTRTNLTRLFEAGSALRRAEARALHREGMTMEQIAEVFGVSRQRISVLLQGKRKGARANGAVE